MVKLIDKVVDRLNQKFDSVGLKRKVWLPHFSCYLYGVNVRSVIQEPTLNLRNDWMQVTA